MLELLRLFLIGDLDRKHRWRLVLAFLPGRGNPYWDYRRTSAVFQRRQRKTPAKPQAAQAHAARFRAAASSNAWRSKR
jgi:hypothetical protein